MNNALLRNTSIFLAIFALLIGILTWTFISGEKELERTDNNVLLTQEAILEAEQLSALIEGMLAEQRGYLLTKNETFLDQYKIKQQSISEHILKLQTLSANHEEQLKRLNLIQNNFTLLSERLDERAETLSKSVNTALLPGIAEIDKLRDELIATNKDFLTSSYVRLENRLEILEFKKNQYFTILIVSLIVGGAVIMLFNIFLLRAQKQRGDAEQSLKGVEESYALAIEGTQDGIFDWDIKTNKIFFSARIFSMLGYNKSAGRYTVDEFKDLIHPEDAEAFWEIVDLYLDQKLSEYSQEFRMKHHSGRWVWIQSRAKAFWDDSGKPLRMVGAHTDISAMIQNQEKIEAEKKQAERANQAKSDFLAHMSHEIRTPLTAISGIAEILNKQMNTFNEKQQQLVKTLGSSTSGLKDLITDILDFSKIESGELDLTQSNFMPEIIFEETISMMAMRAHEKGISFVFDYSEIKGRSCVGDAIRLRQILVNLVGNAIKFTDQGRVTIKAEVIEKMNLPFLKIDIADTGIGIAPENFDLVFERFKQADSSVARKYGGTGLGLPISRKLAQLMGGDIILNSQKDEGSTFSLLLPYHEVSNASDRNEHQATQLKALDDLISETARSSSKKLLIVEDYEGNIVVISFILDHLGLEYDIAKTGIQAIDKWSKNRYDTILMDVQMPEMDGFTATSEIRRLEKEQNIEPTPIIGMTAHALIGDKSKCIEAGMDSYLPKPLVEADLKKELLKYLNEKKKAA